MKMRERTLSKPIKPSLKEQFFKLLPLAVIFFASLLFREYNVKDRKKWGGFMTRLHAVVLAAGKGTRMRSALPKVLHTANGKPLLAYVIDALKESNVQEENMVVVVGHGAEQVRAAFDGAYHFVLQEPQLGTGHALQLAMPALAGAEGYLLVVCGDTPLLRGETLRGLVDYARQSQASATVLSAVLADPSGYGRLLRDEMGNLRAIVEQKDAGPSELAVKEINTGAYCFYLADIRPLVAGLKNTNAQNEYYITDLIAALVREGKKVNALPVTDAEEILGVNDRVQLAQAAAILRSRKLYALMTAGVSVIDPAHTYIETDCQVGADTVIEPGVFLRGRCQIGANCLLGPDSDIRDSIVGDGSRVQRSVLDGVQTGPCCEIGPFSYMRPGCIIGEKVKVGGFVEMKKALVDDGSKIPHLSYVGDAEIGKGVNIGCGTITCNYNGYTKEKTIIEDNVFVGSNSNLIAPVRLGKNAYIGAGSTISRDVPADALAVERGKESHLSGWAAAFHAKNRKKQ